MELTEAQILILRGLAERPTVDIPAVIGDELIDVGYVTARTIDDRTLYEITDDGRAALDRMDGA